jgi:hypothetical protein
MHWPAPRLRACGISPVVVGVKVTGPFTPLWKLQSSEVDTDSSRIAEVLIGTVPIVLVVFSTL